MTLILSSTRCPPGVGPQRREVVRSPLSIGRGAECNWVLPDTDRVLSKRHCMLTRQGDDWLVTDTSSNGTLLAGRPLDPGVPRRLRGGERLTLGGYEFEVRIDDTATLSRPAAARERDERGPDMPGQARPADPGSLDAGPHDRLPGDPFDHGATAGFEAVPSVGLPRDFDPAALPGARADAAAPARDDVSGLSEAFVPPRVESELLPEDWDRRTATVTRDAHPASPAPIPTPNQAADSAPTQAAPSTTPSVPAAPGSVRPADPAAAAGGFAAFAQGAGLGGEPRLPADDALRELGRAFRAAVAGLRRAMIARAAIKGEFRIDQTMIQVAGNNPLKFAADDDDALAALLGIGRQGGMPASRAIAEALRDMRGHELAVMSAMSRAVQEILAHMAPERLLRELPPSPGDALPGRRKQRAWDSYQKLHERLVDSLGGGPDAVFDRAFMRAYEAALADLAAASDEDDPGRRPGPETSQ